jgi:hypothetical protein
MSNLLSLATKLETKHLHKVANSPEAFERLIAEYDTGEALLLDFANGMKLSAALFAKESDLDDPNVRHVYEILLKQANLVFQLIPAMEALDQEMFQLNQPLKLSQSIETKWRFGMDPSYSDTTRKAPASDHNNAAANPANFSRLLSQMKIDTNAALAATNKLLALPQFQQSSGLKGFKRLLPQLAAALNSIEGPDSQAVSLAENFLEGLKFFSDPGNAGSGYDPQTHAKVSDGTSPGHFVDNLIGLSDQLKTTMEF